MGEPECLGDAEIAELVKWLLRQVQENRFLHYTKIDKKAAKRNSGIPGPDMHVCEADWQRAWEKVGENTDRVALIGGFRETALYLWIAPPAWTPADTIISEIPLLKILTKEQREQLGHALAVVVLEAYHRGQTLTVSEARHLAIKGCGVHIETDGPHAKQWGPIGKMVSATAKGGIVLSSDGEHLQPRTAGKTPIKPRMVQTPAPVTATPRPSSHPIIRGLKVVVETDIELTGEPLVITLPTGQTCEVHLKGPGGEISFLATRIEIVYKKN